MMDLQSASIRVFGYGKKHIFLSNDSYWVKGIAKELVEPFIEISILCYGVYEGNPTEGTAKQIGFQALCLILLDFHTF